MPFNQKKYFKGWCERNSDYYKKYYVLKDSAPIKIESEEHRKTIFSGGYSHEDDQMLHGYNEGQIL